MGKDGNAMAAFFANIWSYLGVFFATINPVTSLLDILLVAVVIYTLLKLVQDSRAEQLVKGILLLAVMYLLSWLLDLKTVSFLLEKLFDNGLVLLVVIFQPEIRRLLEHAGHSRFKASGLFRSVSEDSLYLQKWENTIAAACEAVELLQKQKMGALMVFERNTRLSDIADSGTVLNADATPELIGNIFFNKAPLHDGAMIIRDGQILAAGCILPLTDNLEISSALGTRHRAAVGMSENSDALVLVVSEETGCVSVAHGGVLEQDLSKPALRAYLNKEILQAYMKQEKPEKPEKKGFWRWSK